MPADWKPLASTNDEPSCGPINEEQACQAAGFVVGLVGSVVIGSMIIASGGLGLIILAIGWWVVANKND